MENGCASADREEVGSDGQLDGSVAARPPSGASDMVPVRAGSGAAPAEGGPVVPVDLHWHPGLVLPPVGGARMPRWDQRGARYRASVTTFGPVGRVVLTVVLVGILAWLLLASALFFVAGIAYVFVLVPLLRDVWSRAPVTVPSPPGAARAATRDQSGVPE